jgi:hypothetical protein
MEKFITTVPEASREGIRRLHALLKAAVPKGFEEATDGRHLVWQIPLTRYPDTYNKKPFMNIGLGANKGGFSLHLCGPLYVMSELKDSFVKDWEASTSPGKKKLNMGMACVRFKNVDELALDVIQKYVAQIQVDDLIARVKETEKNKKSNQSKSAPRKRAAPEEDD